MGLGRGCLSLSNQNKLLWHKFGVHKFKNLRKMIGLFEIWMMTTNAILALVCLVVNYLDRVKRVDVLVSQ